MNQLVMYQDAVTGLEYAGDIGETTPVSWRPRGDLRFEEWQAIGNTLQQVNASLNWWIGDWLNYGEQRWGEMYAQAMEVTGWEYQRLANAKYVCGRVEFSLRKENLKFSHHIEVASLEPKEQAAWLNRAEVERWSVRRLRDEIKGLNQLPAPVLSLPVDGEPDEVPFNHAPRRDVSPDEWTAIDEYEQGPVYTNGNGAMPPFHEGRAYPLTAANHAVSSDPNYDGDEWYTPAEYIEAARQVMGGIDLDPASCAAAQETVRASVYLTKEDDALRDEVMWRGRVWLNPPYSMPLIRQFVTKLLAEYDMGNISEAIVLTNNSSDTAWFHDLLLRFPACFTRGRVQFWRPDSDAFGARQGQALFYLGDNLPKFRAVFSRFGVVVTRA